MSMEKLKRVMQRIRARHGMGAVKIKRDDLARVIMREIGTCKATYFNNVYSLVKLGWIATRDRGKTIMLTGKDLEDDFDAF